VSTLIENIAETVQSSASARKVFGDPIQAGSKTIIPVAKVAYGFGGGSGRGRHRKADSNGEIPSGDGAGGGIAASPYGIIEITEAETRLIRFPPPGSVLGALAIGFLIGTLRGGHRAKMAAKRKAARLREQQEETSAK
jgi:uncharacterized spore protein YtfJ